MKFILTPELGRLSRWLRVLGYDAAVEEERKSLPIKSLKEGRVILTRDTKMPVLSGVRTIRVKSDFIEEQLAQVIKEAGIKVDQEKLFSLCVFCDEVLEYMKKEDARGKVPGGVYESRNIFMRCPKCSRIYWHGSHWELVQKFIATLDTKKD